MAFLHDFIENIHVYRRPCKKAHDVGLLGSWNFLYIIFFDFFFIFHSEEQKNNKTHFKDHPSYILSWLKFLIEVVECFSMR